jgi:D-psicose/D-tagatose/L-ribulose 3-epimerase
VIVSMCEWVFAGADLESICRMLSRNGYDGIEIAGEPDRSDRRHIAEIVNDAGLTVTGITPQSVWPTDERDLSHPDAAARQRAVDYFRRCVELSAELGGPPVGVVPNAVGRVRPYTSPDDEWQQAIEGIAQIAEDAKGSLTSLGIEPLNRYESYMVNRIDQAARLIDDTGIPSLLGIIADSFHMSIEEENPATALTEAGSNLICVQLADSNRLGLGMGHMNVLRLVAAARDMGFNGPFTMEFTAPGWDPFNPNKGETTFQQLDSAAAHSIAFLRESFEV